MNLNAFREKPFYLDDDDISWVRNTFNGMSREDKTGQLFYLIVKDYDAEDIAVITRKIKAGGVMCRPMPAETVVRAVTDLQRHSGIPMLISANLEAGGNGISKDGTKIGSQMMVAATGNAENAYNLGKACAAEGAALGANNAFAPVLDIDYNFRNPITNTRTFGSDPAAVAEFAERYMDGCQGEGMVCTIKHFPGDGRDERDQHLCTTVNDFSAEEWDATYGSIYKRLIERGAKVVMAGHIMQPAYSRLLNPSLSDGEILPASLSKELLGGLLRDRLGFNGLIVSDATTMAGFDCAMPRSTAVPYCIAAGCDMFLFTKNLEEDYAFMKAGVEQGIITEQRLDEAVLRILGLKAALKLHKKSNIPDPVAARRTLGCAAHREYARKIADECITLVKQEKGVLPITPQKYKNVLVCDIESGENAIGYSRDSGIYEKVYGLLTGRGFNVTRFAPCSGTEGRTARYSDFVDKYDLIVYFCNLATKSNQTAVRIEWMNPMGVNVPRYVCSVPTIFVSTENPYHLLDVPMVKTYINTYGLNDSVLPLLIDKLTGKSPFKGISPVDPSCGKWDVNRF